MDNQETLASLDTQDTEWRQRTNKKTQKTKKMSNTESRQKLVVYWWTINYV